MKHNSASLPLSPMAKLNQRRWKRLLLRTVLVIVVLGIAGLIIALGMRCSAQKRIAEATKIAVPPASIRLKG